MADKMKVLSLFAGIGGFDLGLERAGGFEVVAQCEIDPFCRAVLKKHWPHVRQYEDVRTLSAAALERDGITVDAICGGFPCQDLSFAGNRVGLEGARSGLWSEFRRLIGELRPRFVIVENVPGLLSLGMGTVLGDLSTLRYDAVWECIPASSVGAPHRRDRVWILAHSKEVRNRSISDNENSGENQNHEGEPRGSYLGEVWPANHWGGEPGICRVVDGVPPYVDRVGSLGNAVVPQIPELIGRAIMEAAR